MHVFLSFILRLSSDHIERNIKAKGEWGINMQLVIKREGSGIGIKKCMTGDCLDTI